jgi:hypothetical protein
MSLVELLANGLAAFERAGPAEADLLSRCER